MAESRRTTNEEKSFVSSTSQVASLLPPVNSPADTKKADTLIKTQIYTAMNLQPPELRTTKPKRIMCLDVDETLIDFNASYAAQKLVFIHREKLDQKIKYAVEHDILLAIVTSRSHPECNSFLSIENIVLELGKENFAWIFYTHAHAKSYILDYLWEKYYFAKKEDRALLCLVDDQEYNLRDCMVDYLVIKADKEDPNLTHLALMQDFMEGKPLPFPSLTPFYAAGVQTDSDDLFDDFPETEQIVTRRLI